MADTSLPLPSAHVEHHFVWLDYSVFGGMLLVSTGIGLYHGCRLLRPGDGEARDSPGEFLIANGKLGTVPVALSMLASFLSSITLMGQPAEVYLYGSQMWIFGLATFFLVPFVGYVMIPFFRKSKHTSAYQYFGHRFNRWLQLLASFLFSIQMVLYLALVLYAPALAMHQVTGFNTILVVSIMYIVCIFYTTIGGMKAVVWTDTFQVIVLYCAMFVVLVKGTNDIGGFNVVWERNAAFNRTNIFNWTWDPTVRYSVLSSFIGSSFLHMAIYGGNQLQIQRYLTVGSDQQARNMLWINMVGWTMVVMLTAYAGMLIFAHFCYCDPLLTGTVTTPDQLFPLYVMETLHNYPGVPGLFMAGIFSAGLSTVSTGVNSLAAIWFAELDGTNFKEKLTEKRAGLTVKLLALFFGILSYLLVFLVPFMGGLVPVTISLSSIFAGSLFGVFILGMFFKRANTVGAAAGLISSVVTVSWICIGSILAVKSGQIVDEALPSSTDHCPGNFTTISMSNQQGEEKEYAWVVYRVSYLWYCLMAQIITIGVGLVVSVVTEPLLPPPSNPSPPPGYTAARCQPEEQPLHDTKPPVITTFGNKLNHRISHNL
ncbi:sodium-coupled monocarboxylate transporter 2-like [Macrosteles quadrilineatus]|uniref:sodium-coupled monocarboxylate transporter 2-like n=1 Tax=Macrosteles quadrilineatus TaxID=74068 RepID=UPI0023E22451|nr:sodium-coupled monocarboxylate transporter 2-like [Macrosteles quadrilineatus]